MSQENVKKFFSEFEKNQELKNKFIDAMKDFNKESENIVYSKIVELGTKSGFNFTETDLRDAHAEAMDKMNENGELNDSDLVAAAGGRANPGMVLASIFTLGIACAAVSLAHAKNCRSTFEVK